MSTVEETENLAPTRRSLRVPAQASSSINATILLIYTISLSFPIKFQFGALYLTMSRLVIICLIIPMILRLFSGRYGGIKTPDIAAIMFCTWAFVAMAANHGPVAVFEKSTMYFVETFGAYLIGRIYIRSQEDLYTFVKYLLIVVLISVPFVLYEMRTGIPVVLEFLRGLNPAPDVFVVPKNVNYEPRMGMERSQYVFQHPIFYGVFCASLMALAITVRGHNRGGFSKIFWSGVVFMASFASLSSGAMVSLMFQLVILGFEKVTRAIKARWKMLTAGMISLYVLVDILASHPPIVVFVSRFSFNPATAHNRVKIFEYGSAEVWRNPIFGIGNNDWIRPAFMPASVDNHWLLDFMRYGFPGGLMLMTMVIGTLVIVGRAKTGHDDHLMMTQRGYMAALIGWCLSLCTVSIGAEVFSYFLTLLAGGLWIADKAISDGDPEAEMAGGRARGGRSRDRAPRGPREGPTRGNPARGGPKRGRSERERPERVSRETAPKATGREQPARTPRRTKGASPRAERPLKRR